MFPPSPEVPRADLAACARALRTGSHSFHLASRLLPARVREPALALYAFCRVADDAVDLGAGPIAAVARLRGRLDRIYAGRPDPRPADRGLAWVVERHDLPRALPQALIDGLAWDAEGRRYATLPELRAYAARVAGAVGAMMAVVMGARTRAQIARATDLGVAMQLTNIARDVGEDARAGRLYLPLDWLAGAGITPGALLACRAPTPALRAVIARLLEEAARLYARADAGISTLPLDCRPAIFAARHLYAAIGADIARAGHDSVTRRARTATGTKAALAALALGRSALPGVRANAPPLPECTFLVDAAAMADRPRRPREQAEWVIELLTELEKRDRSRESIMSGV